MRDSGEWETVPDSARRLGIGERKAYRLAAKLSDADVKVSVSGKRIVRQLAMDCLTGTSNRQTESSAEGTLQSRPPLKSVRQASDSIGELSDNAEEVSDSQKPVSDTTSRLSDNPSPEFVQMQKDLARVEDENRFMREQLSLAMSGWREEQRRTRELEKRLLALPVPATDIPTGQAEREKLSSAEHVLQDQAEEDLPAPAPNAITEETPITRLPGSLALEKKMAQQRAATEKPAAEVGLWARLWGWLKDK